MASTLTLYVPGPAPSEHRKVTLATIDGGIVWTVPLLRSFGFDNLAARWSIEDRPGTWPITTYAGQNAVQPRLEVQIGTDVVANVEQDLRALRAFAIRGIPVVIGMGRLATHSPSGAYVITNMSLSDVELVQGSNELARATATLEMVAALTPDQAMAVPGIPFQ